MCVKGNDPSRGLAECSRIPILPPERRTCRNGVTPWKESIYLIWVNLLIMNSCLSSPLRHSRGWRRWLAESHATAVRAGIVSQCKNTLPQPHYIRFLTGKWMQDLGFSNVRNSFHSSKWNGNDLKPSILLTVDNVGNMHLFSFLKTYLSLGH